jgi:hypothetical protein
MTREEHNAAFRVDRQPNELVYCNTLGYGELSQYGSDCAPCWLGHSHTWEEHDRSIERARGGES